MQQHQRRGVNNTGLTHRHGKRHLVNQQVCRFCTGQSKPLYHVKSKHWVSQESTKVSLSKQISKMNPRLINQTLPLRYSQSQTYYYTKPINEFLNGMRNTQVIKLKETISFSGVDGDEWMRRFYFAGEVQGKIHLLTEYYRFHNEIPRLFMIPESDVMNNYHDKKRRIEYFRIAREIEDENKRNPDKPPKGIVGDKPDVKRDSEEQSNESAAGPKVYENLLVDISVEQNVSQTLQEINQKLGSVQPSQRLQELTRQFEKDLSQMKKDDDETLKGFLRSIKPTETGYNFNKRSKNHLNLQDEFNTEPSNLGFQKTSLPRDTPSSSIKSSVIRQPQSARNTPQVFSINQIAKTTANKIIPNKSQQQFFLSEALQAKLLAQSEMIKLKMTKQQQISISPRTMQPKTQVSPPQKCFSPKAGGVSPKTLIEAYQNMAAEVPPILSAKNQSQSSIKNFFPSNNNSRQLRQAQEPKKNPPILNEASPSSKAKPPLVVGSQTHRVTSHKEIQNLLKQKDSVQKDSLHKLLSPLQQSKQLADFFMMQIQAIKSNQSASTSNLRSSCSQKVFSPQSKTQIAPQIVRRGTKNAKFRKSLNNPLDHKHSQPTLQGAHIHTRSDTNQDSLKFSLTESTRRVSKV